MHVSRSHAYAQKFFVFFPQGVVQAQRQVIGWFEVSDHEAFTTQKFPVFILEDNELGTFYGFPEFDGLPGMKIGKFYHLSEACEQPDELNRSITAADEEVPTADPLLLLSHQGVAEAYFCQLQISIDPAYLQILCAGSQGRCHQILS